MSVPHLTTRQREVLQLAAEGLSNYEIAERLGLAPRSVAGVFEDVYKKWRIKAARQQAIVLYLQGGRYVAE
jgi:DNA-binding NarL/FixJ family response regulator